jgi:hypothetical protein
LKSQICERQENPEIGREVVNLHEPSSSSTAGVIRLGELFCFLEVHSHTRIDSKVSKPDLKHQPCIRTHFVAPKALDFVSSRMAENVFVITAMNRLRSQKFKIMTPAIKNRHEKKNSASIIWYMTGDHPFIPARIMICNAE